jgi:hypothetical protein
MDKAETLATGWDARVRVRGDGEPEVMVEGEGNG